MQPLKVNDAGLVWGIDSGRDTQFPCLSKVAYTSNIFMNSWIFPYHGWISHYFLLMINCTHCYTQNKTNTLIITFEQVFVHSFPKYVLIVYNQSDRLMIL